MDYMSWYFRPLYSYLGATCITEFYENVGHTEDKIQRSETGPNNMRTENTISCHNSFSNQPCSFRLELVVPPVAVWLKHINVRVYWAFCEVVRCLKEVACNVRPAWNIDKSSALHVRRQ